MQIRPFTPSDTEAVLAIWLEASLQAHHFIEPAYWHANLAPMREIYLPAADSQLLCLGEQVLGFYSLHEGSLAALFVAPRGRGKGWARPCSSTPSSSCRPCDCRSISRTGPRATSIAHKGFQVAAEGVDPHTGCAEWLMVWPARD